MDHEFARNELYLLGRCGYSVDDIREGRFVLFAHAAGSGKMHYDPHMWGDRTYLTAHKYVSEQFDNLIEGAVIDVQFILGETLAPEQSERFYDIVRDINDEDTGGDQV